jgi:hypothetical protein
MKYLSVKFQGHRGYEVAYERRDLDPTYSDKTGLWNVQPLGGTMRKTTIYPSSFSSTLNDPPFICNTTHRTQYTPHTAHYTPRTAHYTPRTAHFQLSDKKLSSVSYDSRNKNRFFSLHHFSIDQFNEGAMCVL